MKALKMKAERGMKMNKTIRKSGISFRRGVSSAGESIGTVSAVE